MNERNIIDLSRKVKIQIMKIMFLTRFDFTEDRKDGGLLCSYRNYNMLCNIYGDNSISVCILTSKKKQDKTNIKYIQIDSNILKIYLNYLFLRERCTKKQEKEIVEYILMQQYDLVFFDGSTFGQIVKRKEINRIPNAVFFHNVERQYTWEQVKKYNFLCVFRYFATRYNERFMVKFSNKIICLNKRDAMLINKFYKKSPNLIMPITFEDTFDMERIEKDDVKNESHFFELLYVGSYYAHNYIGLDWFIKNVMPYVKAHLTIIGKNMEKIKSRISDNNKITVIGTVDDLTGYYIYADAMVMPIFMGGGMKVKTAEAFMYGKTVFASREALEGYEVQGVESIIECNTAKEFIKRINQYIDKGSNSKFHREVRDLFLSRYCTERYLLPLKQLIEE